MRFLGFIMCLTPILLWCQIGGSLGYQSLNLTNNPRTAALGGTTISLADGDISQFLENPSTLDSVGEKNVFVNFNPYFADTFIFSGAYSFNAKGLDNFAVGITYVNFGSFAMTDESGSKLGTFQAQDYTFFVGKAHQVGIFTLGTNLKLTHSSIENYGSTALLMDIGGTFRVNSNWTVAMVFENMGFRLSSFTDFDSPQIPFDVKLGTTFKPKYMPLRFTLTSTNLVNDFSSESSENTGRSNRTVDQILKRVNFGAEVLLNKHFQFLIGYSHKRKQELKLDEIGGGAGLSYGLMLRVKRIEFRFSRATYHAAGGSSFISLRTDLNDFKKIL
ncbi:type IX secretion system protein PorQ [Ekhidna sp.]|uniref:type IX secretion system protein PorQ n=1 Tax=Ekhidna sp. TaxID=2608089 RepID=UPI003299847C